MTRRERIIQLLTTLATIALSVLAARFGIPIPPPVVPPIEMPPIVIPPGTLPPGAPTPDPSPDPANALVRLSFRGVGCSATVIGPRRQDGRWFVLTAAHCCERVGQSGTIRFLDGRTTGVTVASFDRKCDAAWLVTEDNSSVFPFALLATSSPTVGTRIWHAGYGVDRPGNKEAGEVLSGPDSNGQIRMRLSVSSGDSGGGIIHNDRGEVISCVCCTAARGQVADTWGSSPEAAQRAKPTTMVLDDWVPLEIPLKMPQ